MDADASCAAIERIHDATACYTATSEIEALLDELGWPEGGGLLLDPGCGSGNMVVAAIARLSPTVDAVDELARRVLGVEFHAGAVQEARGRIADMLAGMGWSGPAAGVAATRIIRHDDFLTGCRDLPAADAILANPPYLRRVKLPDGYLAAFDEATPRHARGDLLHAYLERMASSLRPGGRIGLVSSDRWLLNSGAAALRESVGTRFGVHGLRRLDSMSAFHRPKSRVRDTPPRVHAVSMVLAPGGEPLTAAPHRIEAVPDLEGVPLGDLVELRLAPYLGPDGIFMVAAGSGIPERHLVPCVEPRDICPRTGAIAPTRRWAILTGDDEPCAEVMEHLDRELGRMPASARRRKRWQPPERFDRHLPLDREAILVPRLAQRLRAIRLPAGTLASNHSLVVVSGLDPGDVARMLEDPRVQRHADALALGVEGGFKSYTATLLRQLVIPYDLIPQRFERAA